MGKSLTWFTTRAIQSHILMDTRLLVLPMELQVTKGFPGPPKLQLLLLSLRDLRDKTLSLLRTFGSTKSPSMDIDQSFPRSDLLPHHSDEGEWEFPIEDISS
jgi:hypothetical protein